MIHLIFLYVKRCVGGYNFILLYVIIKLFQAHLLKRLFFFYTELFCWNQLTINVKGLSLDSKYHSIDLCAYTTPSWLL